MKCIPAVILSQGIMHPLLHPMPTFHVLVNVVTEYNIVQFPEKKVELNGLKNLLESSQLRRMEFIVIRLAEKTKQPEPTELHPPEYSCGISSALNVKEMQAQYFALPCR